MIQTAAASLVIDISTSVVAVITVLTAIVVGLATLARPSAATIVWGSAFGLGMLGSYFWLGGYQQDDPVLRAAASGVLLCFEPLIWLGLRLHARRRIIWWPAAVFVVGVPLLLVATAGQTIYQVTFRLCFVAAGVFAALIVLELVRLRGVARDITLPLMLASALFVALALASVFTLTLSTGVTAAEQLGVLRGVNSVGTLLTSACAAFTLVLIVRSEAGAPGGTGGDASRVEGVLRRAEAQNDPAWSLLDVRLDDQSDLREASTASSFAELSRRFHADVEASVPAGADIRIVEPGHALILFNASEEAVRHHLRAVLDRVSTVTMEGQTTGLRVSASIGWAAVATCGYDADVLRAAAADAATAARAAGGDRWARAEKAPTTLER